MEFVNDLSQVPWSVIDGVENVRDAVFLWERLFSEIANEHALLKIKRANPINNIDTCWNETWQRLSLQESTLHQLYLPKENVPKSAEFY